MPFPNFHANRLRPPGIFDKDSFRTTKGGTLFGGKLKVPVTINLIWGKLKGRAKPADPPVLQSLRFQKTRWTVSAAKAWISKNLGGRGIFEPATVTSQSENVLTDELFKQAVIIGDIAEYDAGEAISFEEVEAIAYDIEFSEDEEIEETAFIGAQIHQLMTQDFDMETSTHDDTSAASEDNDAIDDEPETQDIEGIEIFAVGTWKKMPYTHDDLDEIAANFTKLKDRIKPPVKLGHNDKQLLLQADGMPAAGWITKLRRVDDKLIADIRDVPSKIAQIVKNRGYARVSSEIYPDLEDSSGTKYGKVLKAIAFLGGDIPHLKNLDDIIAQYGTSLVDDDSGLILNSEIRRVVLMADLKDEAKEEVIEEEETTDDTEETTEETTTEEETQETTDESTEEEETEEEVADETTEEETTEDETTDETDDLKAQLAEQDKVIKEMAEKDKIRDQVIAKMQANIQTEKDEKNRLADEQFLSKLTASGQFPPAMKPRTLALMTDLRKSEESVIEYSDGDEAIKTNPLALFMDMLTEWPKGMSFAETAEGGEIIDPGSGEIVTVNENGVPVKGQKMADAITKYMEEHEGVSYEKAYPIVYAEMNS